MYVKMYVSMWNSLCGAVFGGAASVGAPAAGGPVGCISLPAGKHGERVRGPFFLQ